MKKFSIMKFLRGFILLPALVSIAILTVSCDSIFGDDDSSKSVKYTLIADNFPEDSEGYTLLFQSLIKEDDIWYYLDEYDLGTAGPTTTLTKTVSVDKSAECFGFYLIHNDNEFYFYSLSREDITDSTINVSYWVDFPYYSDFDRVRYGINRSAIQPFPLEVTQTCTFYDAPYYLYMEDNANERVFRATIQQSLGTTFVWSSDSLTDIAGYGGTKYTSTAEQFVEDIESNADTLYLLVVPEDIQEKTQATVLVNEMSDTLDYLETHSFTPTDALTLDGKSVYLIDTEYSYYDDEGDKKVLKKWYIDSGEIETIHTFDYPIRAWALDGTTLYISAGARIFKMNMDTEEITLLGIMSSTVTSLSPIGDKLLVYDGDHHLVQTSDGTILSSTSSWHGGRTTIWVPSQKRIYYYCDGISPNDLCYLEVDPETDTFGNEGESPYHGDYSFSYPLIQLGSSLSLVTGDGDIFTIDASTESKIAYQGSLDLNIMDMITESDRIIILANFYSSSYSDEVEGCRVITLSRDSPYNEISRTSLMSKETGIALLSSPAGYTVVTKTTESVKIGSEYFKPVKIRNLDEADLAGTTAITSRSAANDESRSWAISDGPSQPVGDRLRLHAE